MWDAFSAIPEEKPLRQVPPVRRRNSWPKTKLQSVSTRIKKLAPGTLQHTLFFGGLLCGSYGFWLMYHPLGFIVLGVLAVWVSFLLASEQNESSS